MLVALWRTWGWRALTHRVLHELRRSAGAFKTSPRFGVQSARHSSPLSLRPSQERLRSVMDLESARRRASRVAGGEYEAFGWEWRPLPRTAEEWRTHPLTHRQFPQCHWWRVPHLSPVLGDIKQVWEPHRFGWTYDLVRGFLATGDERYAAAFHSRFRAWLDANPPFLGAAWACGQETAIRCIALLHAEACLAASEDQRRLIVDAVGWSGERIHDALEYAASQRNNHILSEAAGLIACGVRLAGLHSRARHWLRCGRRLLEREILDQFDRDGWYIQHSFNYLRLALDQCTFALRLLRHTGLDLSAEARERLSAAVQLLAAVTDPQTGRVPRHGADDGSRVIPVADTEYDDFRPCVTAAAVILGVSLPGRFCSDAQTLAWLNADAPPISDVPARGFSRGESWVAGGIADWQVFLRAGEYRSRPGHMDLLHLDVRWKGRPIVVDPGTYSYNAPPPWNNGLASALVHNGPVIDGQEPALRGPRFLWLTWPRARLTEVSQNGSALILRAQAAAGVTRTVEVRPERIRVTDRAPPGTANSMRVLWTLDPEAPATCISAEPTGRVRRGEEGTTPGWVAPRYGMRVRTQYLEVTAAGGGDVAIVSEIRPPEISG